MDSGGRELKPSASDEGARPLNYSAPETRSDSDPLARVSILCTVLFVPAFLFAATFDAPMPVFAAVFSLPFLAVAFGWLARRAEKTRALPATTLAQSALWISCFALAILLLGAVGFLMPELRNGRETVGGVQCEGNLRQIGQALDKYAQAHSGQFPPDLVSLVRSGHLAPGVLVCPASGDTEPQGSSTEAVIQKLVSEPDHCSYVYVAAGLAKKTISDAQVLAYERNSGHRNAQASVLFGDGHVEMVGPEELGRLLDELRHGRRPARPGPASSPE
jgi:prepilin-type processing-associated H-X9-DG protein